MKKRRQLDALVDSVKLPKNRSNSFSAQEPLVSESESSEEDTFNYKTDGPHHQKK